MSDDSAVEAARRIVSEFEEPGRNGWLSSQFWPRSAVQIARALLSSQSQVERMREALEKISAEQWKDRSTVSELNAWPAFQRLNSHVVELYAIADAALTSKEEK